MIVSSAQPWWQAATIYQIYPRSFADSDGDGIGDLNGIADRLDYLVDLGIDCVWISPIYPSPMADFGYDVADYTGIDPRFGTLADFDALLEKAHGRGIRVLLDFVPNHSSDRHDWFVESRSSRDNPKRDWYIWRDPAADGGPPNNWISDFGGPAWSFDPATGQYYSRAFLPEQPDLNWRNPDVQSAMLAAMRFWFDRGVDGFRIDVQWHMVKHADFPDNPPNPDYREGMGDMHRVLQHHSTDQPEVHAIATAMRRQADEFGAVLVGEIYLPIPRLMTYYGTPQAPGVHLPFNFQLIEANWNAAELAKRIVEYEAALPDGGWPNWVLGNHDRPRIATRVGAAQARVAAMLLLTLRGTPTLYQGDELGLGDAQVPADKVQDPRELREPGLGLGRDPVRTPLPWTAEGGFTTGDPWLPIDPAHLPRNAQVQAGDPASMLSLYRRLLALRRATPALATGAIGEVRADGDVLSYIRSDGTDRYRIVLNLGDRPAPIEPGRVILSTHDDTDPTLRPAEGRILKVD
ncbi:alpha-amylase family glycosyl hydrolase [Sphingomonas sp. 2R-10]|uniref:alpha-amylase family glycosyl hydrolase n=1 Tax=Sphingomonas sp. 2R-10 TaxID=3045148 RepID=UPI0019D1AFDD|nr:alpha-amylase family glycosyl hydrolase [Sphingomonas sp. 2R-10]MDJ0277050.1 alpha-amylase family glycosyl hydrolase [Sphingomonas sp. 2R-10]